MSTVDDAVMDSTKRLRQSADAKIEWNLKMLNTLRLETTR